MPRADKPRLYLITPPRIDEPEAFAVTLADALEGGDVAALQVRLKDSSGKSAGDKHIGAVVKAIQPLCEAKGVALIINDRPDLAIRLGCDGVHVGQEDAPYEEARRILGPDRIVGVTCHDSRHLAMEAAEAGADYVAFGAFYDTTTKDASTRAELSILEVWQEAMTTPCVAIGGIMVENAAPLIEAGADFLAVSGGVWSHPQGPRAAVVAFNALLRDA
jgi:thiamine-phosphate pyrophosphorylase